MVDLIKIVEGFFACGVAASVYCMKDASGAVMPDTVFANVGKLLLSTQIYDMHRLAHQVSGGLVVALPGPDEDHNPETAASLAAVLGGRAGYPGAQARRGRALHRRPDGIASGRLVFDDLAAWRRLAGGDEARDLANYPVMDRVALVERLLDRGRARSRPARIETAGALLRHRL